MPTSESTEKQNHGGNSSTAPRPPIFRSSMSAPTGYRDLLLRGHDVSNVTFHISACALKCQNVFASGGTKESCSRPMCIQKARLHQAEAEVESLKGDDSPK